MEISLSKILIFHTFGLNPNCAFFPALITLIVVSFSKYDLPPAITLTSVITLPEITGVRIAPFPVPLTSKIGGALYELPELKINT